MNERAFSRKALAAVLEKLKHTADKGPQETAAENSYAEWF